MRHPQIHRHPIVPEVNSPPRSGPATAEQLQVMLRAWDHLAREEGGTISAVITHTQETMPPPPMPANARAAISQIPVYVIAVQCTEDTQKVEIEGAYPSYPAQQRTQSEDSDAQMAYNLLFLSRARESNMISAAPTNLATNDVR
jgi:hypothetical protein